MNNQNVTKKSIEHLENCIKLKKAKIANISKNIQDSKKKLRNLQEQIETLERTQEKEKENLNFLEQSYQKDRVALENKEISPKKEISNILPFILENKDKFKEEYLDSVNNFAKEYNINSIEELIEESPRSFLR